MRSKLFWGGAVLGLFGVFGLWVLRFKAIFFSPDFFLPRDSYLFHWRIFDYVSQYLKFFGRFPEWDFRYGISLIPFGNNFLLFMPYRWIGYALVAYFGVDSVTAYKVSFLIFGQGLFLLGIFLFHKTLLKSKWAGLLAVVLACLSSLSFALFHQEQMLGTLFFIPWVGWALLKRYGILALALLGFSLNCHYPQLLFIYYGICFLGYGFFVPHRTRFRVNHTAILCFLVALGPLIYSYARYNGTLRSSFRDQQRSIEAASFEDYQRVNKLGPSSVHPRNFSLFLQTTFKPAPEYVGDMDNLTFHATLHFQSRLHSVYCSRFLTEDSSFLRWWPSRFRPWEFTARCPKCFGIRCPG
jgi:hypothetical protein